jgi:DNA-binding response OmpR family regulator
VIVLDLLLPDLDGFSICEILRAQPSTRDLPVVVFNVLDRPLTSSRGARAKIFRWLKKGPDFDSLCDSVGAALAQHSDRVERRVAPEAHPPRGSAG